MKSKKLDTPQMHQLRFSLLARARRGRALCLLVSAGWAVIPVPAGAQSQNAVPDSAPVPAFATVRPGEIALDGTVQTVGGPNNSFSLAAVAYTVPDGRTRPITPAKLKIILPAANAAYLGASPGALKVGARVRVYGPDQGSGQPLAARLVIFLDVPKLPAAPSGPVATPSPTVTPNLAVPLPVPVPPAAVPTTPVPLPPPTPPQPAPPLATGSDGGYTLNFLSSQFTTLNALWNAREGVKLHGYAAPIFFATFSLTGPDGKPVNLGRWIASPRGSALTARLSSPQGQFVPGRLSPLGLESSAVNPDWPSVNLDLYGRDPSGRAAADGTQVESATLDFAKPGNKPETLNVTTKTASGVAVTLDDAVLQTTGGKTTLQLGVHWSAPDDAPDTEITPGLPHLVDHAGNAVKAAATGYAVGNQGHYQFQLSAPPAGEVCHVVLSLNETLLSQSSAAGRFHIRMKLPMASGPTTLPAGTSTDGAVKVAKTAGLEVRLSVLADSDTKTWAANAALINLTQDPTLTWALTGLTATDAKGHELPGANSFQLPDSYWRSDGSRTAPGDSGSSLRIPLPGGDRPATLDLHLTAESRHFWHGYFSVEVPIATAGTDLHPNLPVASDQNLGMVLDSERHYASLAELPGLGPTSLVPVRGLALHFTGKLPLAGGIPTLSVVAARDNVGRSLQARTALWMAGNLLNQHDPTGWTLFLPEPAPDAQTALIDSELVITGQVAFHGSVSFAGVPVPAAAVH